MEKKLTRVQNDKILAGVCSGFAKYFGMDVALVRILAGLGFIFTGFMPGALVYLVCWIAIPESDQ